MQGLLSLSCQEFEIELKCHVIIDVLNCDVCYIMMHVANDVKH